MPITLRQDTVSDNKVNLLIDSDYSSHLNGASHL